jgi:hypothetical protein
LKKRTKKLLLITKRANQSVHVSNKTKVFWFFFSKKNCFLPAYPTEAADPASNPPSIFTSAPLPQNRATIHAAIDEIVDNLCEAEKGCNDATLSAITTNSTSHTQAA